MHDPTRGGLLAVFHEVAQRSGLRMNLDESDIPIRPQARAVCDLLGLEPLSLACEGRVVLWVPAASAAQAVAALREHPLGRDAAQLGRACPGEAGKPPVVLNTSVGGERPMDLLSGADLPRIC
jgi:hydrogenase expression/formation protein HypE